MDVVCREGPSAVLELVAMGADFTKGPKGDLHLTREGGHSHRRVVHAADLTGKEVERALLAAARSHPNISILEHHAAVDLVCDRVGGAKHCLGLDVLDTRSYQMQRLVAPVTMLASGGAGGYVLQHASMICFRFSICLKDASVPATAYECICLGMPEPRCCSSILL